MEDKSNELAGKVSAAIITILEKEFEGIENFDSVTGILMGATAVISFLNHEMSGEDNYKEVTAKMLTEWADSYTKTMLGKPDSKK